MSRQIVAVRMREGGVAHADIAELVVINCGKDGACAAETMSVDRLLNEMETYNDFFVCVHSSVEHTITRVVKGGRTTIQAEGEGSRDDLLRLPRYG